MAAAQDQPPQTPGEVLQAGASKMQSDNKLPGVIGMVRDGDKVDYAGYGDMFMRVPADTQAQFRIGSNTKQFTPTVLLSQLLNHPSRIPEGGFTNYALGVGRIGTKCGEVYTHTGEVPGYTSTWISSGDGGGRQRVPHAQDRRHGRGMEHGRGRLLRDRVSECGHRWGAR